VRRAIVRLVEQARVRPSDPDLFSGLVLACRYGGLLETSLAAHQRSVHLDPGARTSVAYTHWFRGDFQASIDQDDSDPRYLMLYSLPMMGREAEALEYSRQLRERKPTSVIGTLLGFEQISLERDRDAAIRAFHLFRASSFHDPEGMFFFGRGLARCQAVDEAMDTLARTVEGGFFCAAALAAIRGSRAAPAPGFAALVEKASAGRAECASAFIAAGGERLLGTSS
jgi:hypothetical protein